MDSIIENVLDENEVHLMQIFKDGKTSKITGEMMCRAMNSALSKPLINSNYEDIIKGELTVANKELQNAL